MYTPSNNHFIPTALLCVLCSIGLVAAPAGEGAAPTKTQGGAFLQVVNATSVPVISLRLNAETLYPSFPQGMWIDRTPWKTLGPCAAVNPKDGAKQESEPLPLDPGTSQTLVVMGDFSTNSPPDALPQPEPPANPNQTYPPNVLFRLYPHALQEGETSCRYRFVNAMPRVPLQIEGAGFPAKSLRPGEDWAASGQPLSAQYTATAGEAKLRVALSMRENANQIVIFYLKGGKPAYVALQEVATEPQSEK